MNSEIPRLEPRRAPRAAVAALIGSLLIPVACGDNTVDSTTTTPPITITIPESTTTKAPTTTEALPTTITSTTVPEITTTTEAEYPFNLPADITRPTGEIKDRETNANIPLGLIGFEELETTIPHPNGYSRSWNLDVAVISGRLARAYKDNIADFRDGILEEHIFLDVVVGEYTNGDPIIYVFDLGQSNFVNWALTINEDPYGYDSYGLESAKISELLNENSQSGAFFLGKLGQHAQVIIRLPLLDDLLEDLINDSNYCTLPVGQNPEECETYFRNLYYNASVNTEMTNLLQKENINPEEGFSITEYGIKLQPIEFFNVPKS